VHSSYSIYLCGIEDGMWRRGLQYSSLPPQLQVGCFEIGSSHSTHFFYRCFWGHPSVSGRAAPSIAVANILKGLELNIWKELAVSMDGNG
jgi:hypothetical protein